MNVQHLFRYALRFSVFCVKQKTLMLDIHANVLGLKIVLKASAVRYCDTSYHVPLNHNSAILFFPSQYLLLMMKSFSLSVFVLCHKRFF